MSSGGRGQVTWLEVSVGRTEAFWNLAHGPAGASPGRKQWHSAQRVWGARLPHKELEIKSGKVLTATDRLGQSHAALKFLLGLGDHPRQQHSSASPEFPGKAKGWDASLCRGPCCRGAVSARLACGPASLWGGGGGGFVYKFLVCLSSGFPYLFK